MDITSFLGGQFLAHVDLPAPFQVWTIKDAKAQIVGTDNKVCVFFNEHHKPLGLNKTNLKAIAQGYTVDSTQWIGRPLEPTAYKFVITSGCERSASGSRMMIGRGFTSRGASRTVTSTPSIALFTNRAI